MTDFIQVGGVCYGSPASALQAMAASMYGSSVLSSGQVVSYSSRVSDQSIITVTSTGVQSSFIPDLIPCQQITWLDALILSGCVVAAWAAVWGVAVLRRAVDEGGQS